MRRAAYSVGLLFWIAGPLLAAAEGDAKGDRVSYDRDVRPIFQAHCQGCHQPAKASGGYDLTTFARMLAGGESGLAAVAAGQPDESYLLELITPVDGEASMPQGQPPLSAAEIAAVRRWIEQGAEDDGPPSAGPRYDQQHPPVYPRAPVIPSLDYSPDGSLLAVAGFHEVLLHRADGSGCVARMVGMAERIETVRFSPDGSRLAVIGGRPGRGGELQVWAVADVRLELSVPATFDTIYGGSWSPDGKLIAFGGADNTVRAIEAASGREVMMMAAHEDWVRGTVFSGDGNSIFSVSRDMTVKMTDLATQRFVGNVTTHTPGVLRGGMLAIDRHPARAEIFVGSADGAPKLFKMETTAAPASGGNPNQIREYPAMPGRVFDVAVHPRGDRASAVSSLDGSGQIWCYEVDTGAVAWRSAVPESALYSLACSPDGSTLAAAGSDGRIRLLDEATGALKSVFLPVTLEPSADAGRDWFPSPTPQPEAAVPVVAAAVEPVEQLLADPADVRILRPTDAVQFVLTGRLAGGEAIDLSRSATWRVDGGVGQVTADGLFRPLRSGRGTICAEAGGEQVAIPVEVASGSDPYVPDFVRDVNPILSRLGCNQGTCHGAAKGKNGFKLSLRGYDALLDIRALTDDLASRRVNAVSPDDSLMLLKAGGAVPHQGGQLTRPGEPYYQVLRRWIADGATLDLQASRVIQLAVFPQHPIVQALGSTQQMRVVATYADGSTRDVTREAFLESGNTEVAAADRTALMTAIRRGEAAVLARYEGAYAATTLTVMGDRTGFAWSEPEAWGRIDELVAAKWQRLKIQPSPLCSDHEFLRRVSLDLSGLPPTADEVRSFFADQRETRVKRDEVIDRLLGSPAFVEHWTNKWADLLQVNRKFLGPEGSAAFREWIRAAVEANKPYDQFAREILTASGSNRENPPASYYKILRDPLIAMENTTHLFLGVRFNCNKCHDHPFERWTQDQYYQTAAFLARIDLKPDPEAGDKKIGGSAVEGAAPLYETVGDKAEGEVVHDRTGQTAAPAFPFECRFEAGEQATRRERFAAWITSPDNPYFARSFVNRLWGYLLGTGIIEPLDDIRAGNPPTNPELLDHLADAFVASGFDARRVLREICRSRTYQLSVETNPWNEDDATNYSHAIARRLPAEVLYDAIYRVTGAVSKIPGVPDGTRAAALPDAGVELPDGFLANLGRPVRESACECERSSGLQLGPVMALISGPTVDRALSDPGNALSGLAQSETDDARLVDELFLRILNRPASQDEIAKAVSVLRGLPEEHQRLQAQWQECEQRWAPRLSEQEQQRREAVDHTEGELKAYEQEIADREAELDRQRAVRIAQAETALNEYAQRLPKLIAAWEQQVRQPAAWRVLEPLELLATNNAVLDKQEDGSIFASGPNGKTTYKLVASTDLQEITGVKLELFADDRLPGKGPGRAPNGNFVLSEFRVERAAESSEPRTPVKLQNAQADYSQQGFDVASAIDGKAPARNNGWATHPETGKSRTAVFETQPGSPSGPGSLTVWLDQQYQDGQHTIGRFRISVTDAPRPIRLDGLPENIAAVVAIAAGQRTAEQRTELETYYRGLDGELKRREQALSEARQPRPVDPRLQALQKQLAEANQPVPIDPELARLREDTHRSAAQLERVRLTFAQDLAWALINSPAFLFNH